MAPQTTLSWLKLIIGKPMAKHSGFLLEIIAAMSEQTVLVLGDSHADIFNHDVIRNHFASHAFEVVAVNGASLSGLSNPNSQTQALPIFRSAIARSEASFAIFMLGEVDTGFLIWYRSEKSEIEIAAALAHAVDNYAKLMDEASETHRVICISAPLPTIKDGQKFGAVANARRDAKATQRQRTELTLQFNQTMREWCLRRSLTYLDLDVDSLGADGLVRPEFLHPDPTNHHYHPLEYAQLLVSKLNYLLGPGASNEGALA